MIDTTQYLPDASQLGAFILRGWFSRSDSSKPVRMPDSLFDDVLSFGIYAETLVRRQQIKFTPEHEPIDMSRYSDWIEKRRVFFESAEGYSELAVAETKVQTLLPSVRDQLLFMPDQVFCFYPSPDIPFSGWREFYWFCFGYNHFLRHLKEVEKEDDPFGKLQLIHLPPK